MKEQSLWTNVFIAIFVTTADTNETFKAFLLTGLTLEDSPIYFNQKGDTLKIT